VGVIYIMYQPHLPEDLSKKT